MAYTTYPCLYTLTAFYPVWNSVNRRRPVLTLLFTYVGVGKGKLTADRLQHSFTETKAMLDDDVYSVTSNLNPPPFSQTSNIMLVFSQISISRWFLKCAGTDPSNISICSRVVAHGYSQTLVSSHLRGDSGWLGDGSRVSVVCEQKHWLWL